MRNLAKMPTGLSQASQTQLRGILSDGVRQQEKRRKEPQLIPPPPIWQGEEYPRIDCGRRVVCVYKIQGPEWVRAYCRNSIRLECHTVDEPGIVSAFLNLGGKVPGEYRIGKQSNYYKAWVLANGGPPKKGQTMDWNIFLDKWFLVEVSDCTKNSEGKEKGEAEVYSRITKFLELTGPKAS